MYCNCGNVARLAEIGYIEPMTTGAPLSFAVVDDALDVAADDDVDVDVDVVELLLEQAAVASARHATPAAKTGHFLVAIISPPYAERWPTRSFRTLIVGPYFRALYSDSLCLVNGSGHSSSGPPKIFSILKATNR
jgi:hypothetical protein